MLIQTDSFATYGTADNLLADSETIRQYAGRSSLSAVDSISIHFLRSSQWTTTLGNESKAVNGCFSAVSECCFA